MRKRWIINPSNSSSSFTGYPAFVAFLLILTVRRQNKLKRVIFRNHLRFLYVLPQIQLILYFKLIFPKVSLTVLFFFYAPLASGVLR